MSEIEAIHPRLPFGHYRLRYRASEHAVNLGHYPGSAWRGVLGGSLRRIACLTRANSCEGCSVRDGCIYSLVFESPPDPRAGKMGRYNAVPHPYVLRPVTSGHVDVGDTIEVEMVLVGHATRFLSPIVSGLERSIRRGHGPGHSTLTMVGVEQRLGRDGWMPIWLQELGALTPYPASGEPVPALPQQGARIRLLTPLRIRRHEQYLGAEQITFGDLFRVILRRLSMLTTFHTDFPLETDFAALVERADQLNWLSTDLRWQEWSRFSGRQQREIQMGGLMGEMIVPGGEALAPFWPCLWLSQWFHAGKGTVMGLGRLEIDRLDAAVPAQVM